ncbi:MAG: WYL domain-containing protein [Gammaproteobacteria bacterium]|nr:WYL domain-containing protein [Gammaproteobacteria bacterium]
MAPSDKLPEDIKWNTRQRLQYIEIMAYYTGVVTRSDVAKTFGISDAAATKDLTFYGKIAPDNLQYKQNVFGFVPNASFKEVFADLSPDTVLPMIANNLSTTGGPVVDHLIYGVPVNTLPLPSRLPDKTIVAQVTRAAHQHKKLGIVYNSLSDREPDKNSDQHRIIEPHSLIDTGLRWHVRAYSEDTFDFRDFVLSRITDAKILEEEAESSPAYDDDWIETITLKLTPHPNLNQKKQRSLLIDYGATDEIIEVKVKRALVGYILQKLSVDTTQNHSLNPDAYHLIIANRDEVEPFAGWAFL